ncbi:cell wall-active antibiotics response protein LiaF [Pradoshia sp.]
MSGSKEQSQLKLILVGLLIAGLFEIIFIRFDELLFNGIAALVCLLYGYKNYATLTGKIVLWVGIFFAISGLLSLFVIRAIIFILLLLLLIHYLQKRRKPAEIKPSFKGYEETNLVTVHGLVSSRLFGNQSTPEEIYEWDDINAAVGFGDVVIDLSNTVLPKEESIIAIRNIAGNVEILIPYDISVKLSHTALYGSINLFDQEKRDIRNQQISYKTEGYEESSSRIKIVTSIGAGSIVVRRV